MSRTGVMSCRRGWIRCANETGAGAVEYVGSRPRAIVVDQLGQSGGLDS